jgi:ATP-dependent Clp protease ATP-binding subunit ClpA
MLMDYGQRVQFKNHIQIITSQIALHRIASHYQGNKQ